MQSSENHTEPLHLKKKKLNFVSFGTVWQYCWWAWPELPSACVTTTTPLPSFHPQQKRKVATAAREWELPYCFPSWTGKGTKDYEHCSTVDSIVVVKDCYIYIPIYVYPTTNGGTQNGSSVGIYTRCMHVFACFGSDLHAQSVLHRQNFCSRALSEVYQECVVGWVSNLIYVHASNLCIYVCISAWFKKNVPGEAYSQPTTHS